MRLFDNSPKRDTGHGTRDTRRENGRERLIIGGGGVMDDRLVEIFGKDT